jgi:hypothetical protein
MLRSCAVETILSIALGIGLAAATGFRVFVPLLAAGVAAHAGWIDLSEHFAWLNTTPALFALGTAALFEALAYYVPGVDHLLDVLAAPAAAIAGVLASAAVMTDVSPALQWPIAIIGGGSVASLTKATTALVRTKTGIATAGLGNPIVSTAETAGSTSIAVLALLAPLVCFAIVALLVFWMGRKLMRVLRRRATLETT